jgi:hypothetical protein
MPMVALAMVNVSEWSPEMAEKAAIIGSRTLSASAEHMPIPLDYFTYNCWYNDLLSNFLVCLGPILPFEITRNGTMF